MFMFAVYCQKNEMISKVMELQWNSVSCPKAFRLRIKKLKLKDLTTQIFIQCKFYFFNNSDYSMIITLSFNIFNSYNLIYCNIGIISYCKCLTFFSLWTKTKAKNTKKVSSNTWFLKSKYNCFYFIINCWVFLLYLADG